MKIVESSFILEDEVDGEAILKKIERAGRTAYKSEDKITEESARVFVAGIMKRGHLSVIEHESISVRIILNRAIANELVRHRLASYTQESSRFCSYLKGKFGSEITVINPCFWAEDKPEDKAKKEVWKNAMLAAELAYFNLLSLGAKPEEARNVLPLSLKTEIVVTMNLRSWRNFFELRCDKAAHPEMRKIAGEILSTFKKIVPVIFDDLL
jgi:thymidylate synthase (FAD)